MTGDWRIIKWKLLLVLKTKWKIAVRNAVTIQIAMTAVAIQIVVTIKNL